MKRSKRSRDSRTAYLMIAPFFVLFTIFVLLPILANFIFSFTNFNMITMEFAGLKNYIRIFTDDLLKKAFLNTVIYSVFNVGFIIVLSFIMAVLLNRAGKAIRFARASLFLPYVTSMVAVSMIWMWLYDPNGGIFNRILSALGFQPVNWLLQVSTALGSIIVMSVWKNLGYNMVLFLAGLQGVPTTLYEAAEMDGANRLQKIWYITIPMIKHVFFLVLVTNTISSFNVFESVNVMTAGGPLNSTTTIAHQIYTRSFAEYQVGYGSAIAIMLSLLLLVGMVFMYKNNAESDG